MKIAVKYYCLFCLLFSCLSVKGQETESRPNIIILFADDQRASTLLNPEIHTPNLDKLRERGFYFPNAHIMGANNGAVCTPSRAMLLTGRRLGRLEKGGFNIPEDYNLLGRTLQKNGYDAFGIGKWHNNREAFNRNFNGGEAIFMGGMHDHWNTPLFHYSPEGNYQDRRPVIKDDRHTNKIDTLPGEYAISGKHSSEIFAGAAIDFINSRKNLARPFFLYTAFTAPHDPRTTPPEYLEMYDTASITLPPNFLPRHPFDNGELIIRDEQLAETPRQPAAIKQHILEYYAMITHLDAQIGRILHALQKNGLAENTIIVFAGDNGLAVGQHGLMGKQNLYQHSINVPLIIAGPGLPAAENRAAFCYLTDLFPTLCELTGTPLPDGLDGKSLLPAIRDKQPIREAMHFQYRNIQGAIRKGPYKLIRYLVEGKVTLQLFNLEEDPWEVDNQVGRQPRLVRELWKELETWEGDYGLK